jgi:hypothetical protein
VAGAVVVGATVVVNATTVGGAGVAVEVIGGRSLEAVGSDGEPHAPANTTHPIVANSQHHTPDRRQQPPPHAGEPRPRVFARSVGTFGGARVVLQRQVAEADEGGGDPPSEGAEVFVDQVAVGQEVVAQLV